MVFPGILCVLLTDSYLNFSSYEYEDLEDKGVDQTLNASLHQIWIVIQILRNSGLRLV